MKRNLTKTIMMHCEGELQENQAYLDTQKKMAEAYQTKDLELYSELSIKLQMIIEKAIYKLAVRDIYELLS